MKNMPTLRILFGMLFLWWAVQTHPDGFIGHSLVTWDAQAKCEAVMKAAHERWLVECANASTDADDACEHARTKWRCQQVPECAAGMSPLDCAPAEKGR
jgi:hypothetical protein